MEVLQHLRVGRGILQDHQDLEGEALRCAIIFQLMGELCFAVGLEYNACHPTIRTGVPVDGQAVLFIALKGAWVLGMVDQDRLQLAVSGQVNPEQEDEMVLICLKSGGALLLPRDVCFQASFSTVGQFHSC